MITNKYTLVNKLHYHVIWIWRGMLHVSFTVKMITVNGGTKCIAMFAASEKMIALDCCKTIAMSVAFLLC
jgi:hypothetical protein